MQGVGRSHLRQRTYDPTTMQGRDLFSLLTQNLHSVVASDVRNLPHPQ